MLLQGGRVPAGWPLGLETLSLRMSIMDAMRSADPHPSLLATPSFSSLSSSDFDTESSLSFFPDRSITLGSLIGIQSDRPGRHGSSCVHPEDGTQMGRNGGIVAGRTKNYRRWRSFMGCMYLNSVVNSQPPSLGHFLRAEKKAGASSIIGGATSDEKVFINIMYEESEGVLPDANAVFLGNHSSRMGSRRLASLDLAMIQEESPPRLSNPDGLKDWGSSKGGLPVRGRHRRALSQNSSCLSFMSNFLGRMSSSKASLGSTKIGHL